MERKQSFTLIELLVVIAIIGILSSLVIARFSDWGDNARIANTLQWSAGVHRTLGANLVGHWPLDKIIDGDKVMDLSGYGNNGTIYESPSLVTGVPGTGNQALEFDSDYIVINHKDELTGFQKATFSWWMKRSSPTSQAVFIMKYVTTTNNRSYYFREAGDSRLDFIHSDNGERYTTVSSGDNYIINNEWILVAITFDNGYAVFYKNGSLHFSDNSEFSSLYFNPGANIYIGAHGYKGLLSDIRIYNTALTAEEVGRIYAETKDSYLVHE